MYRNFDRMNEDLMDEAMLSDDLLDDEILSDDPMDETMLSEELMDEEGEDEEETNVKKSQVRGSYYKKEAVKKIQEILDSISEEVGCKFPKNFATQLYQTSYGKEAFTLNKCHARGIIDDWRIWEPFVDPNDASKYISHKLEVLCKIHCGVTYGYKNGEATSKSFIGNFATVLKEIPDYMYTIIHSNGLVSLNGRPCPVEQDDPRAAFTRLIKPREKRIW